MEKVDINREIVAAHETSIRNEALKNLSNLRDETYNCALKISVELEELNDIIPVDVTNYAQISMRIRNIAQLIGQLKGKAQ